MGEGGVFECIVEGEGMDVEVKMDRVWVKNRVKERRLGEV